MKEGEIMVLGVSTRVKDGKKSHTLYGSTVFEDWENGVGVKTIQEWTRCDLSGLKIGSVIMPIWGKGFQGHAVLNGYQIISEPAK